uniref:protein-histidine N-methyltransferase n=1 Tax=Cairina moschata TaxID=8855 RepID=A0A8C3BG28_CAIMO
MAFRFNFAIEENESTESDAHGEADLQLDPPKHEQTADAAAACSPQPGTAKHAGKDLSEKKLCFPAAREHHVPEDVSKVLENKVLETVSDLRYVKVSTVEMTRRGGMHGEDIVWKSISAHSDLIPGVYEGGLKIWECTFDLLEYLAEAGLQFANKAVLDLGCGAGLLGIAALRGKAAKVHFQDYNSTVIDEITLPNVVANCVNDGNGTGGADERKIVKPPSKKPRKAECLPDALSRCRFFSGEWSEVSRLLLGSSEPCSKYDVILTSETIYNPDYYGALHDTLSQLLDKNGRVYLASKVHYFGVGGGVYLFEKLVEERKVFTISTVKETDQGLKRFVMEMAFKDSC